MNPNYPRMMFHRSKDPVTIHSEEDEAALGPEWSRTILAALAREEKPARTPDPEQEPEEEEPEEPDEQPEPEDVEQIEAPKPKRGRPPAHKLPHKTAAQKRKT